MIAEIDKPYYEGLNVSSVELWRAWLRLYQDQFTNYRYNVRVGQGIVAPAYLSDVEKAQWKALTQKRIDVVADHIDEHWIIEIVERPGLASVGQLIGYLHLAEQYLDLPGTKRLALICARMGYDMGLIFKKQNVLEFIFPPGKQPRVPPTFLPTGWTIDMAGES